MSEVRVTFALSLGADFVREGALPAPEALRGALRPDGLDGAVIVSIAGQELLDERYWDRLDATLERLIDVVAAAGAGQEATVELPDTRLEVTVSPRGGGLVHVDYGEGSFVAPSEALSAELRDCAGRLLGLVQASLGNLPEHYSALRSRL